MKRVLLLTLIAVSCSIFKSNGQVLRSDSLALVALYNSTGGANWKTPWILSNPVKTWSGIGLDDQRKKVTSIQFPPPNNNISGPLPSSLGNLSSLRILDLSNNNITGKIPASFAKLDSLQYISFSNCNLTGKIPLFLGSLKNLKIIYLSSNKLTGTIPDTLTSLPNLTQLVLESNELRGKIPALIGNLKNLTALSLGYNKLTGSIPSSLENLINLETFDLSNNELTGGIPKPLGNLQNLTVLNLKNNNFSSIIPSSLGNLPNLVLLYLEYNKLTGEIPETFGNLTKLLVLGLNNNLFNGTIPSSLSNLYRPNFYLSTYNNQFNFDGLEVLAAALGNDSSLSASVVNIYSPQSSVRLNRNSKMFSVSAGGKLSNNTYRWFKNGKLIKIIVGDSTYSTSRAGDYYVSITNSVATQLTLYSDTLSITGLAEDIKSSIQLPEAALLYPNPTKDLLNISLTASHDETAEVKIVDMNGKTVSISTKNIQAGTSTQSINVSSLSNGIYFIEVKTAEGSNTWKFVKK